MPMITAPNNSAYTFGGVYDIEDDEEDITGTFFNDLYSLDLEKLNWRQILLTGKRDVKSKRSNKKKEDGDDVEQDKEEVMEVEPSASTIVSDDGIFTVTVGPTPTVTNITKSGSVDGPNVFQPSARMNCGLAVKHGVLYLYGGMVEDGSKQLTLCDFYSLGKLEIYIVSNNILYKMLI